MMPEVNLSVVGENQMLLVSWSIHPQFSESVLEYVVQHVSVVPHLCLNWVRVNRTQRSVTLKGLCVCKSESCSSAWCWHWFCVCLHPQVTSGTTQRIMFHCSLSSTTTPLSSVQRLHTHLKEVWHFLNHWLHFVEYSRGPKFCKLSLPWIYTGILLQCIHFKSILHCE